MWIDRVVELAKGRRLVAIKAVSLAEEHLHDHFPADASGPALPVMPASLIIEGMAQTAGILVGHMGDFRDKIILAKVMKAQLDEDVTPGCCLRYTAEIQQDSPAGTFTSGLVERIDPGSSARAAARPIGRIDLLFSHLDQSKSSEDFPEHNFVFGESFRTLLRQSGVDMPPAQAPA